MSNITIQQPHPLRRNGTKRIERLLAALSPDYFQLDDRSMQDLLVAAHRYSQLLAWYDFSDRPDGDWTCFWETETLTYLAVLSAIDLEQLRKTYDDADRALGLLLESTGDGETEQERDVYRALLGIIVDMAQGLEDRLRKLENIRHPLQHLIYKLIERTHNDPRDLEELVSPLRRLIAIHKAKDDDLTVETYQSFIYENSPWGLTEQLDYGRIMALAPVEFPREQLRSIFLQFYQAYVLLKNRAQAAFDAELARMEKPETEEYRIVQPHISLFIAFLRLFRHAQDSLNELVGKQLDFYYEEVLGLKPAPAQADSVYLIFELAKNFEPQLVEGGTKLLGGKDNNGRPIFYETVQDWVISQAKLEELKGLYFPTSIFTFNYDASEENPPDQKNKTVLGLEHTLPINTDGVRAFADNKHLQEEEVGFVIASPQLLLQEGKRFIHISITNATTALSGEIIELFLSTEEGWTQVTELDSSLETQLVDDQLGENSAPSFFISTSPSDTLEIKIFLPKDFPGVIASPALQISQWPGVKVVLKKNSLLEIVQNYDNLLSGATSKQFTVSVRAEGVSKNLILQTDQGVFDGTQEVLPFGATAPKGARFHIGFAEAFLKKIDSFTLRPNWVEPFDESKNLSSYYSGYPVGLSSVVDIGILNNNVFTALESESPAQPTPLSFTNDRLSAGEVPVPIAGDSENLTFNTIPLTERDANPSYVFTQYDPSIRRGFIRITFQGELFHKEYAEILAAATLEAADNADAAGKLAAISSALSALAGPTDTLDRTTLDNLLAADADLNLPNPPYTPTFNSMELDYVSSGHVLEETLDQFIYLHPFGGYERATWPVSETVATSSNTTFNEVTLFKDFSGVEQVPASNHRGHLYLGFSALTGGSSLSMLIQTVEGSEKKPEVNSPAIAWHYLTKNNRWVPIPSDKIISDGTRGMTKSGIIQLGIPSDISSEGNTILNPELTWLKVTSSEEIGDNLRLTAALPDLAYVKAQVIEASFDEDERNDPGHLTDGQSAGSISKLAISRSAIKKIEQPFATFGGRLPETEGMAFYLRISERLRHRDRAVTLWDYEHLLLEAYPDIAIVKCIPHTQYHTIPESELNPGSVVVAVIPDLAQREGFSRNQPRFPKGYLDDMRDFLLERATLFLHAKDETSKPSLYVTNGQYEQLQVTVSVVFNENVVDEEYFKLQLNKDLRHFLSPWIEGSEAPCFGNHIRRSQIIHFIELRPYINFIDMGSLQIHKDGTEQTGEYIRLSAEHGILCSAPSHTVSVHPST